MKLTMSLIVAAFLVTASCSRQMVRPGHDLRGSLPPKTHTLADIWSGAGNALFLMGQPMKLDVYTEAHHISGSGIMVIEVRSHDFDPVAAVIDGCGNLLAFNDNWHDTMNSRLVLDGVPSGARLLVFSPDDSRGLYDVVVRSGTQDDLDQFRSSSDLSAGAVTGWLAAGGGNPVLGELLRDAIQNQVYNTSLSRARMYPFTVENGGLVSLSLEADQFDPYLLLMSVNKGTLGLVDYNDDYNGTWSRIVRELEPGDYTAVVLPYSESGQGEFTLRLEYIDLDAMERTAADADLEGIVHEGDVMPDRNPALAWWPGMMDDWDAPSFLSPFSPTAPFTFTVLETAVFQLTATGDRDVCLTVLRESDGQMQFVAANDDHPDMGTGSRIRSILLPGDYVALISIYSDAGHGQVGFSWSRQDANITSLRPGRAVLAHAPYGTENLFYRFETARGRTYTVSVNSEDLDPVITLYIPDGSVISDDDGGDGTNSLLSFTASDSQVGTCILQVDKYSPGDGTFEILLR